MVFALPHDTVLISDGGLATELEARGHDLSDDLWSARLLLDSPLEIAAVHAAFFRAGAAFATTASKSRLNFLDLLRDPDYVVRTLAQQFIQYELKLQPERVVDAMRAALAALPINDRKLKVFLHPQDVELVMAVLALDLDDERWQWLEDPLLSRGGVRLETADTSVNASVEARLARLIEKMLGEHNGAATD